MNFFDEAKNIAARAERIANGATDAAARLVWQKLAAVSSPDAPPLNGDPFTITVLATDIQGGKELLGRDEAARDIDNAIRRMANTRLEDRTLNEKDVTVKIDQKAQTAAITIAPEAAQALKASLGFVRGG